MPETSNALSPLRHPVFRALWIASVASNIGTWMQNLGATWLMTTLAPSPIMFALVQAATFLPVFLLCVPAGALADLVDRRKLLILSQGWMLVAALLLGVLTWAGLTTAWTVIALTFVLGLGAAMNAPAWQAIIPDMVPPRELAPAVALGSASFNIARAVGPAIGGWAVAALGPAANFMLNAVSFLAVIVVLYRWNPAREEARLPREHFAGAMLAGMRYARHSPLLHRVFLQVLIFALAASAIWALLPVVASVTFHGTAVTYGVMLGFMGAGAVLGAAILPALRRRFATERLLAWMSALFALASATLALSRSLPLDCLLLFGAGVAWLVILSGMNIAIQVAVPDWVRARALSIYLLIFYGAMSAGSALWGWVATSLTPSISLEGAGAALLLSAWIMLAYPLLQVTPPTPAPNPSEDLARAPIHPERGPVLVTVEYRIDPESSADFEAVMEEMRLIRRRDGAMRWVLYRDAADMSRYVEVFRVPTWGEHLRQHGRMTEADRRVQERARAFHIGAELPAVRHLIAAARTPKSV